MKILIDNADIQEIKKAYEYFPITGVTCNPTILKKTGRNPYDVLKEIREFIGAEGDLHVQVVSALRTWSWKHTKFRRFWERTPTSKFRLSKKG